ncbi:S9 family peptidase [Bacteroidales bacterium OttesenSCG-928-C19]|nr:S9 family peptidase [Bacteroidales bacterium OttesenSCG-928-C19]
MKKIFSLACLIFLSTFSFAQSKKLELDSLMNGNLYPKTVRNIQFMGKSDNYSYIFDNQLYKGKQDILFSLDDLNEILKKSGLKTVRAIPNVRYVSENEFVLFANKALIKVNINERTASKLNEVTETANIDIDYEKNNIAYTVKNNLFVQTPEKSIQVSDEENPAIVYGEAAHRNEFGIQKGTFWSPKGNALAFYRMDQTMVTDYPLVNTSARIAEANNIKYPMAGMKSHEVTVGVFNLSTEKTVYLKSRKNESVEEREMYLTNITWSLDEKQIYIAKLNREQNHMWLECYDAVSGDLIRTLFEEKSDIYVEPQTGLYFLPKNQEQFIWLSQRDGYNHIYLYDTKGNLIKQITKGNWIVKDFVGFDTDGKNIFFYSNKDNPLENALYSVNISSGKVERITQQKGTHQVAINSRGTSFLDVYNNLETPSVCQLIDKKGEILSNIYTAESPLKDFQTADIQLGSIKTSDGKTDLYYRLITPPNMEAGKKYPTLLYVYGGPHSQMVTESWLGGANNYFMFLAQQGYVVFTVDNRGTAYRGFAFETAIHRNLGTVEMDDQIQGIEFLKSLPYVDTERIAVDGWSYGGFMTITLKLNHPEIFKVATAGGPVIDWKWYEIMYGERYMGSPLNNEEGYKKNSLVNQIDKLEGKLLVIHGAQDPTVVWQNSLEFLAEAIKKGKQLDYFVYPYHEHNVRGKDRVHLFRKLYEYYEQNL